MYLAVANQPIDILEQEAERATCHGKWETFPHSQLLHHGQACCDVAREWLLAMDFAQLNGGDLLSGPRWMRQKYEWGPSDWPIHWCEVVGRKTIDCGVHSAIAHEAFAARGVTAFRAQFVQRYNPEAISQWRLKWGEEQVSVHWLEDEFIYHEGNALLVGEDEVKLWDASAGWWINPRQSGGYGSLAAVRMFGQGREEPVRWGEHLIKLDEWYLVESD
jgi:hypothetical protein